jgi:predicted Ser/Thr protein kinase
MIPATLGRFEILQEIGKGAMGQVFLANDPKIDRKVAIKTIVLPPGTSAEEAHETSQRFLREAQAAGKLLHPGIVTIFDVGEEAGVSFIAMEYIEGETLERFTRPDRLLPPARTLEIISQAAAALDYAHERKIVHRDIKPANLMLLKDGTLKITDFGLAKNPGTNLTQAGVLLGTPSYMSPEQIQGLDLDGRSDLFSLGVVLYELLTGVRPFDGDSISTIIYKVLYEDPRPPAARNAALPPDVNVILERALAKDKDRRYASGADLAADLYKAFASLPPDTLSRPFPATARAAGGATPTVRKERGGMARRPGRATPRAPSAAPAARPTMFAHHPGKIAALLLVAAVGLVIFPRLANHHEPRKTAVPDTSGLERPEGPVNTAALGGAPPPAFSGRQVAIDVETIPHGGTVFLDDTRLAEPKVVLSGSDPEPHTILARAGCRQAEAEMTAADLASFNGPLVLELAPRKDDVLIGSDPAGARIVLNDHDTGRVTPAAVTLDGCAANAVVLRKEGYRPWTHEFGPSDEFEAMAEALKKPQLTPIPTGGLLVKRPKDYDVEIYAGDTRLGKAGQELTLQEGRHTLTFRNDKYFVRETLPVDIAAGRTNTPLIALPGLGTLTVQAQPSNCKVYVDDVYVDVTPLLGVPIAAGGHRVKVVFVPSGAVQEVRVAVDTGKDARVMVKF